MLKSLNILILLFAIFSSYIYANNYNMPVGIPNTQIDFSTEPPARPSNWSTEVAGYYYIDYQIGSDTLTFGTEQQPRKTIPKKLSAGSYVEIAGEYSHVSGGVIKIYGEGNSSPWKAGISGSIWVTSSPIKQGSFTTSTVIIWGSNIFFTHLEIKNKSKIQVGSSTEGFTANNIVISNNELIGTLDMGNGTLLSARGNTKTPTTNVILYKNTLRDAGDIDATTDIDAGLISTGGNSSNVWILDNIGFNASGSGLQINARPPRDTSHHIYAGNNEFYNVRQGGLWVKYASNVVFSSNYVHHIISTPWSPAKGLGGQYEPNGLWIINNRVHDVEYGIRIPSTNAINGVSLKVYIIGNIIYNIHTKKDVGTSSAWESAGIHIQGANERFIYNNLIYNSPNGINVSATSGQTKIKNNIILKVNNSHALNQQGFQIWSEHHDSQPEITITNNYFGSEEMNLKLNNTEFSSVSSLDRFLNNLGNKNDSINFSGLLDINELGINAILENGFNEKLLWNHGENVFPELSSALTAAVGSTMKISNDILNNPRVNGHTVDIGPFEAAGESPEVSISNPAKPANITLKLE